VSNKKSAGLVANLIFYFDVYKVVSTSNIQIWDKDSFNPSRQLVSRKSDYSIAMFKKTHES